MTDGQPLPRVPLPGSLPPDYDTSQSVRTAISMAYSSTYNPRGLEAMWYSPWTQAFTDLVAPYDGHIIVLPQYPLFMSSLESMEFQLRYDFDINNLSYDTGAVLAANPNDTADDSTDDTEPDTIDFDHDSELSGQSEGEANDASFKPTSRPNLRSLQPRKQEPRKVNEKVDPKVQREGIVANLMARKAKLLKMRPPEGRAGKESDDDPDISIATIQVQPDAGAIDWTPDFVLSHVPTLQLPEPSEKDLKHYVDRAGVKVFHRCSALIAELKAGKDRAEPNHKWGGSLGDISRAIKNLMEYCASYFAVTPRANSVIALAAAGGKWKWAIIHRDVVPRYDWGEKMLFDLYDEKVAIFFNKFGKQMFTLGTTESDKELSNISQIHIYPMLRDDHDKSSKFN